MTEAVNIVEDLTDLLNNEDTPFADCVEAVIKAGKELSQRVEEIV